MANELNNYRLALLRNPNNNYSQGQIDQLSEHNFISQYVDGIAKSLSVWDNGKHSNAYYQKLAWGGLESSKAYISKSETDKSNIQKAILDELQNRSGALGEKCP